MFKVKDLAGNETTKEVKITFEPKKEAYYIVKHKDGDCGACTPIYTGFMAVGYNCCVSCSKEYHDSQGKLVRIESCGYSNGSGIFSCTECYINASLSLPPIGRVDL